MAYLGLFSGCVTLFNSTMNKTASLIAQNASYFIGKIPKLVVLLYVLKNSYFLSRRKNNSAGCCCSPANHLIVSLWLDQLILQTVSSLS